MNRDFRALVVILLLFALILPFTAAQARTLGQVQHDALNLPPIQEASPTLEMATVLPPPVTPADVISAVNELRLSNGLNALAIHPVLMQVAANQANALAASQGTVGHQRPCGLTLGQEMLMLGFPLWGDLSLDGYRSENWLTASTVEQVISSWLGDAEHANTMLSAERSHIGAAVAVSNQTYVVLETALRTSTGEHQGTAYDILTGIPMTQTVCYGYASGEIPQYSIPITVSTALPDGDVVHEVQYGQTLWNLADMYHVSIGQIKLLNGLLDDNILPGWKLLIQKGATQPVPVTDAPSGLFPAGTLTETKFPTAVPYYTKTPTRTATVQTIPIGEQLRGNSLVVAGLLIAFSVLLAGIIGFGRRKEE